MKYLSTSKLLLLFVMLSYFVGLYVGISFIDKTITNTPEYTVEALIALFTYIGAPVAVTIGFYSWKAKNENCGVSIIEIPKEAEQ